MKKFALPLLMLLSLLACKKEDPKFTFVLTSENVAVSDLDYDYFVQVDNDAKTVYVEVDYFDKAELAALKIAFVKLPEDVTVTPATSTFNYSKGESQTVTFTQGAVTQEYQITAEASDPEPHFVSVKLNGEEVVNGVAKLKSSVDLTTVSVEYVVSPENTVVKVDGEVIASATEETPNGIDFSDKLNGVKFTLVCEDVTKEETIKVVTTGINSVKRVWGRYVQPVTSGADAWWSDVVPASAGIRTMAMDNENVYLATTAKTLFAIPVNNPDAAKAMDMGDYAAGGVFGSCALACMEDGNGGYVTLLSNMVNSTASEFVIWKWDTAAGKPTKVLSYHLPEAARIGDEMTVEGTWKEGKIWFHDYTSRQAAYVFTVKDGVVGTTATKVTYDAMQGNWGAIYKYDDTQYIGGGVGQKSRLFTLANNTLTTQLELPGAYFANPLHGIQFFTFNEQEYMSYVVLRNSYQDGQLRITEMNGDTLLASLETPGATWKFGIGDPVENDITAVKNGNGCASGVLRVVDGKIYIAAYVLGAGVSVFTIE